jgi:hypothetical protein
VNTGGANAVYWVKVKKVKIFGKRPGGLVPVRNITKGAKVKVPKGTRFVESALLYPLLRGRDVQRWQAEPSAYIIVPYTHTPKLEVIRITRMRMDYPKTYRYLKRFKRTLRARADAMVKSALRRGEPFYFYGGVGRYTFARWKVVWRGQVAPQLIAAVVSTLGSKVIVPDQTAYFASFESAIEAHFFCAFLNSSAVRFAYASHGYKHVSMAFVQHIRIPRFDPANPVHRRLAALSMRAHRVAKRGKGAHKAAKRGKARVLGQIEARIDQVAARVWGLSRAELKEIQQTLRELLE